MAGGWNLFGLGVGISGSGTSVGTNAALSPRQELSFNHLASLSRPVRTYAGDSKPGPEQFQLAYQNVPCRREATTNLSETMAFGRLQGGNLITIESWHFAEQQEIGDNWAILDQSLRPDGSQGSSFGRVWRVRSQPERFIKSERREGGKQIVRASEEKDLPVGVIS